MIRTIKHFQNEILFYLKIFNNIPLCVTWIIFVDEFFHQCNDHQSLLAVINHLRFKYRIYVTR